MTILCHNNVDELSFNVVELVHFDFLLINLFRSIEDDAHFENGVMFVKDLVSYL